MTPYSTRALPEDFHSETRAYFGGRRVLVLGGSGFIGSHLVEQLLALGAVVRVLSRQPAPPFLDSVSERIELVRGDLEQIDDVVRASEGISTMFSLAANVAGIAYNNDHPASIFMDNILMFSNAVKAAVSSGIDRLLVTSSACVYPRHCSIPTPEEEGFRDEPEPTNRGYGWAKRMEEMLGQAAAKEYGLSVAIARPYNAYGPRDDFDPETSHVVPGLIRKALEAGDGVFSVWGDGSHSRSFLYVDDFARGLVEVAARYPMADAVNIGASEETTIRDAALLIASTIRELTGRTPSPSFDPAGLTGQPRRACDTRKAERILDYKARVSFEQGLRRTIEWYLTYGHGSLYTHAQ
jgi:GDP-L-fucose synthase